MSSADESADDLKLSGFKYFRLISGLLDRLRTDGVERDKAGNRDLFFDQYAMLILTYFFNPTVTSLRGIQHFSTLEKVQKTLGVKSTSLGSLSEASRVFDPALLEPIIAELAHKATANPKAFPAADQAALAGLEAVDGSLLKAVPRMAWALWQDAQHRAVKMHVSFAVFPNVPVKATVTAGTGSERSELRKIVQSGGFYAIDRGYADYSLFRELDEFGCHFVCRVQQNAVWTTDHEQRLTVDDAAAGVVRDTIVKRLGTEKHNALLKRPLRVVEVAGDDPDDRWVLVTNHLELPAELIVVAYRYRWQVELFFRWIKCVLGCRHLLSHSPGGVTMQIYFAIIASLLIALWTDVKPNKRTYEMLCHYLSGWATEQELDDYMKFIRQKQNNGPPSK